jgi:CHASE3 domain sensor protein
LLLLAAIAIVSVRHIGSLTDSGRRVDLTHTVIGEIEQVLADLQDAETGQRGFLLTGDERFLDPYNTAVAHLPEQIRALREVTADNAQQQSAVNTIENLATQKLAALKEGIDRRRRQSMNIASPDLDLLQSGRAIMDRIRLEVADMRTREESKLGDRATALADDSRQALLLYSSETAPLSFLPASRFHAVAAGKRQRTPPRSMRRNAPPRSRICTTTRLAATLARQGRVDREYERYRAAMARLYA